MTTTITRKFNAGADVPAWARKYGKCVKLAQSDYSYRANLWSAKTSQVKRLLIAEANRRCS